MASMQCYRSFHETCEAKCHDNSSFGHKVSDMAGMVFKANQPHCNGHQTHAHHHSNQGECFGQTQQTYYTDLATMAKTQSVHCVSNSNSHGHHGIMGHTQTHHLGMGHNSSCSSHGMSCYGKTKNKCGGEYKKKKDRTHCNNRRDGNRSCSDSSSDGDSD